MNDKSREHILEARGIEVPCGRCSGYGVRTYPSTSTWRGGLGGMMLTSDVCDSCWGSGNANRPWPNQREMLGIVTERDDLRAENERLRGLLERLYQWGHMDSAGDGPYWRAEIDKACGRDKAR